MRTTRRTFLLFLLVLTAAATLGAGCSDGETSTATGGDETATVATEADTGTTGEDAGDDTDGTQAAGAGDGDCEGADPTTMEWPDAPAMMLEEGASYTATLATQFGDIEIELMPEEAPIATNNFVFLARECFYTNVPIHRVVSGFVIQSGDPTGTGTGGPGYTIEDEETTIPYARGTVAMARTPAPNSAGSQFFIALADLTAQFPNKEYVIFGQVTEGMDVVDEIGAVEVTTAPSGEPSQPVDDVVIDSVTITQG